MKRTFLIILLSVLALSLITSLFKETQVISKPRDEDPSSEGSPGEAVPVFHGYDFDIHDFNENQTIVWCFTCEKYLTPGDVDSGGVEPFSFGTCFYNLTCKGCGSNYESDAYIVYSCFFCDSYCPHVCDLYDEGYISGLAGHPLQKLEDFPFEPGDSYVIDGVCQLCQKTVN